MKSESKLKSEKGRNDSWIHLVPIIFSPRRFLRLADDDFNGHAAASSLNSTLKPHALKLEFRPLKGTSS